MSVYGSIYKNLRGLKLLHPDAYAAFQSDYVVYHDDAGDYSTNEPTTELEWLLICFTAAKEHEEKNIVTNHEIISNGGINRVILHQKKIAFLPAMLTEEILSLQPWSMHHFFSPGISIEIRN